MKHQNHSQNIIIYNTTDGKVSVSLYAKDGIVWMIQNQIAELFDTSKQNISQHIISILKDNELSENSVVKKFLTTASDSKEYNVTFYSLEMILAIGFRQKVKQVYDCFDQKRKAYEALVADKHDVDELERQIKNNIGGNKIQ